MKEVAVINNYVISELWYKFYVFRYDEDGEHYEGWYDTLDDAIDYVNFWIS